MAARSFRLGRLGLVLTAGLGVGLAAEEVHHTGSPGGWRQHDVRRPKPPVVEPAAVPNAVPPPKDAVVLFDGSSLDAWQSADGGPARWKVKDGFLEVTPGTGAIQTKGKFGDVQLHIEWASPDPPAGKGQDRGNSGIFLMGQYELQVLDSYRADTYADGQAGAIYGQFPPLFNASRPPGRWQTYDVAFRRPRFDDRGKLLEAARMTVFHNGILVQNNEELPGQTSWLKTLPYEAQPDRGPIQLQDHGHPVRFRNLWLRNLPERPAPTAQDLERPAVISLPAEALDAFTGRYAMGDDNAAPRMTVTRDGDHLVVSFPFRPRPLPIQPISATEFDMPDTYGRFQFRRDERGRVTGVLFKIGDGERVMTKVER